MREAVALARACAPCLILTAWTERRRILLGALAGLALAGMPSYAIAANHTVLYSFQGSTTDGADPKASLIEAKGTLYGTTAYGGAANDGTVFAVTLSNGAEQILHSFGDGSDDGTNPFSKVTRIGKVLYGTTARGGSHRGGTLFSIITKTGSEAILHAFAGSSDHGDGDGPVTGLTDVKGVLYGTTEAGGANGDGTVFSFDYHSQTYSVIYSFCVGCANAGMAPEGDLLYSKDQLYGTTAGGDGTVYKIDLTIHNATRLYYFCKKSGCTDGEYPYSGLIFVNGNLYGTTAGGGPTVLARCSG